MVNENQAVVMVNFVLNDPGQKTFGPESYRLAVLIKSSEPNFAMARHFAINVFDTQAAFVISLDFTFFFDDLRVDKDTKGFILFVVEVVSDDNNLVRLVNLDGRQGYADFVRPVGLPIKRSRLHILNYLAQLISNESN